MNSLVDTVMTLLFVLFMVFIFAGYHKTKSQEREKDKDLKS
ncbi:MULTISPECIES: hypothetical protein [Sulfurimonas]|nr:hypothetical protein [Sulfurimonas hydrogeniphila]